MSGNKNPKLTETWHFKTKSQINYFLDAQTFELFS